LNRFYSCYAKLIIFISSKSVDLNNSFKMEKEKLFLLRAIEIAKDGIKSGGGPFGAVVTKDDKIISEAYNRVVLEHDPTAHAEILAIREAAAQLESHHLGDCKLYTSCEPCPMCLGAIYWAGIKKVVYACDRIDAEEAGFSDKLVYEEIILDPEKRKISFLKLTDAGGKEVFKKWEESENKTPY
jgi:guanine deaminase